MYLKIKKRLKHLFTQHILSIEILSNVVTSQWNNAYNNNIRITMLMRSPLLRIICRVWRKTERIRDTVL